MLNYVLQIIVLQVLFLILYEVFLKQETFYKWNRFYLLMASVLALVLPKLRFERLNNVLNAKYVYHIPEVIVGTQSGGETQAVLVSNSSSISYITVFYAIGFLVFLIFFIKKLYTIFSLIKSNPTEDKKDYKLIILQEEKSAFSFLNYIFINQAHLENEQLDIINHELVHIRQKHSWDLLFFELLKLILWFNPLVYIYQKRIREVHEFLTDAVIIQQVDKRTYFDLLLNEMFLTKNIAFTNSFYINSLIKKRILMATKDKSKRIRLAKYLLVLPVVVMTLIYTSCNTENDYISSENSTTKTLDNGMKITETDETITITTPEGKSLMFDKMNLNLIAPTPPPPPPFPSDAKAPVPFNLVEHVPVFPGCENAADKKKCFTESIHKLVRDNFKYPKEAKANGMQGRVYVQFMVEKDGTVGKIRTRGPNDVLEAEAKRIISLLPKLEPAMHKGEVVRVPFSLPITFKLAE